MRSLKFCRLGQVISEFKRLKAEEQERLSSGWDLQRTLAKINYHIHTDAIKVLSNLESINALLIRDGLNQSDRLEKLNKIAIKQLKSLLSHKTIKKLKVSNN